MKKIILYVLIGMIVILVLTNPSLQDFKDNTHNFTAVLKENNFIFFSTFQETKHEDSYYRNRIVTEAETHEYVINHYVGILKNFFLIKEEHKTF
jgi:hypothetical protein